MLYRLLFVLYAEARELLPIGESEMYRRSYSLHAIARGIAEDLRLGKALLPTSATVWPKLKTLFGIIDEGSPPLRVATFNGGLFDPEKHPFLEQHTVGDARLLDAIDKLARVGGHDGQPHVRKRRCDHARVPEGAVDSDRQQQQDHGDQGRNRSQRARLTGEVRSVRLCASVWGLTGSYDPRPIHSSPSA